MIVLITGASRGIGFAVAKYLLENGKVEKLLVTARDVSRIDAELLEHPKTIPLPLDLSLKESVDAFLDQLAKEALWPDVLINNAGFTRDALAIRLKAVDWEQSIEANLTAPFKLTQACFGQMLRKRWGRIISLSSVVAHTGNVGQVNYVAAKAALEGMTRSFALEGAKRNVTVNAIAPGFIDTDMTRALNEATKEKILANIPMGRMGSGEDIAKMVQFILEADYVTGQTFHVNGGLYLSS